MFEANIQHKPSTISSINLLPFAEKRRIYSHIIPPEIHRLLNIPQSFYDINGIDLLTLTCPEGRVDMEMELRHEANFHDPILYGHITDTLNGLIHILFYAINDPNSPRFNIDHLDDGRPTLLGIEYRNIDSELAALQYGLAPGQILRGLRLLPHVIRTFERFIAELGHEYYSVEPLFYHNAILFEGNGFAYSSGKKIIERIQSGFSVGGDLIPLLDGSNPFRMPVAANHIRLRSWAIHDGILGEYFTGVTMYKRLGVNANINSTHSCKW